MRFVRGAVAGACLLLLGCGAEEDAGSDGKVFSPVLSASTADVRAFLAKGEGGGKAKLVFVDKTSAAGELCFIDFSETSASPVIRRIPAAANPSVPVVSPDGNWVVYASGPGAEAGSPLAARSSVYLVRLDPAARPLRIAADSACEPRFVQDAAGKLVILYSTLAPNFAWEGPGKTLRVEVDVSGDAPVVGVPAAFAEGGYTGGLSHDNRYLAGGGGHVAMLDRQGAKGRPDTLSFGLIQSCNASISSSRVATDAVMYLNTSGSHARLNAGRPWGEWQAILISDSRKRLLRGYLPPAAPAVPFETDPASYASHKWHHSEWSNHPHFATATVNVDRFYKAAGGYVNSGYQERVYLLDLRDSAYLEVVRPDRVAYSGRNGDVSGFHWPWLWVEIPSGFREAAGWLAPLDP